ncbi:MAG: ZIP family metal transporter [Thermoanaerobacteraceae bacterium]
MSEFKIIIIGSIAGIIGTGLGGASTFFLKSPSKKFLSIILGITSGLMISIVTFDMLPHAFEESGLITGIIGVIFGGIFVALIDGFITNKKISSNRYLKGGLILGLAIAMHNFPEGLAIGSGFMSSKSLGLSIAIVIALHDFPEGLSMATPLLIGGVSPGRNTLYAVLAGLPTALGTIAGVITGGISSYFISLNLGIAGGAMLYVTCGEIIPQTREIYKGRISILAMILGIIGGIIISKYI